MLFENAFIYHPRRDGPYHRADQPDTSIQPFPVIEDVRLTTEDGVNLHAWYCKPAVRDDENGHKRIETERAILYLHGNAGNIANRYDQLHLMMFLGCAILILDYRGYGRSEGTPSETGLYLDALAAWNHLTQQRGFAPQNITMLGKSLGGAVAVELAARDAIQPGSVILQSPFTSVADMARQIMPLVPGRWLKHKYASIDKIAQVDCPKLFIHSKTDEVVPYEQGRALFDAAPEPKEFFDVAGGGHNDTALFGGKALLRAMHKTIHGEAREAAGG